MNNLLKFEIEEMNDVMNEQVTGFVVDSLDKANWCFRKIKSLQEAILENDTLADKEIERIEAWRERENKAHVQAIEYFETLLTQYYKNLRTENPKAKLSTPYGKVTSRKNEKYIYKDEILIKYCKDNKLKCVKVEETLMKNEFKKLCPGGINPETGEIIPGVTVEEVESYTVKVG